jgi:hypothetical protein
LSAHCRIPLLLVVHLSGCTYFDEPAVAPGYKLLHTSPSAGELNVSRDRPVDLYFDAAPAAETVAPVDVRLFSGLIENTGSVTLDLVGRRIRFRTLVPLRASLRHQIWINGNIRSLAGARLGEPLIFDFTTGAQADTPAEPPRPEVTARDLQAAWTACSACHGISPPRGGVDLSSPEATVRSLSGVTSGGSGLQRVVPGDHARSYLMRKLLGEGGMVGLPMPPDGPRLAAEQVRAVADWIDGGARW